MSVFLKIIIALGILFGAFWLIGYYTNENYEGEHIVKLDCPKAVVWDILTDLEEIPDYRDEIDEVHFKGRNQRGLMKYEMIPEIGGYIDLEILERIPEKRLVVRMIDSSFGLSGIWTYELEGNNDYCLVTISENSRLENTLSRSTLSLTGRDAILEREAEILEDGCD
ncbi:SRPBCC family protein [Xanthovirga aplysinae]|uniref:SRPBCC family protein n=1 Tax=Xanthovirga aplysinae TaxID=2529853 RepID=UPI0012BD5AFC|nr:SRPBCC family protein [Xanthovirga aplysinae]MTI30273.1 SRPBCC family protein [Xanthovirga aplysinae]